MSDLIKDLRVTTRINGHDTVGSLFATLEYRLTVENFHKHGLPTISAWRSGECLAVPKIDELAKILSPDTKMVYHTRTSNGGFDTIYASNDSICHFDISPQTGSRFKLSVHMVGFEKQVSELERKIASIVEAVQVKKGVVKTLMQRPHGLDIGTLGVAGIPLIRENYEQSVLDAFDHVVKDISNPTPCGKLIIMDGPPGTGKTFLIRALIENSNAEFVFIPPNIVSELAGPNIITTLADDRASDDTRPIVMIVEDADQCLQERAMDNLGSISNLLNMTDGIAGAALDIRVVATTNMDIKKMPQDEALLRDGRLCKRIEVGQLSVEKAIEIATRLGVKDAQALASKVKLPRTLASLYKLARDEKENSGEPLVTTKSTKVGFTR